MYCNYSKDKFGNELTFIIPSWMSIPEGHYNSLSFIPNKGQCILHNKEQHIALNANEYCFFDILECAENNYCKLVNNQWAAQQARAILPNCLKTELVMTGFASDWVGFFKLRDDKQHAHPDAYALAHPLHEEFIKRGYL